MSPTAAEEAGFSQFTAVKDLNPDWRKEIIFQNECRMSGHVRQKGWENKKDFTANTAEQYTSIRNPPQSPYSV
jgi:hypothetical protein